ncbi:MAG: hypothetical protein R2932_44035 [Caldilineaceae bacterium]
MTFTANPDDEGAEQAVAALLQALYEPDLQPTTEQLLDYDLGLATPPEARLIELYLADNAWGRAELTLLQALNQDSTETNAGSATAHFLSWLRRQWPDRPPLLALPQLTPSVGSALRGTTDTHAVYAVGPYRLALTIAAATDGTTTHTDGTTRGYATDYAKEYIVQGQLLNQSNPEERCRGSVQFIRAEADTNRAEQVVSQVELDEFGFFWLQVRQIGVYRLVVALPAHTIWIQELHIP